MEKITNYLELIQQIQDITPEKEAFCTTGRSLTYSQLYALAKEKQGMLKQEKKKFPEQNAKKQLRIIQTTCILDQLVEFLACQGTDWIPVILPADATVSVDEWTQKTWPENACMAVMTSGTSGKNKLLFRTFGSWYDYFPVQNEIFHINSESRLFMQGSLAFTGNLNLYMGQLAAGATILAQERFDPRLWIRNIKQWQANGIYLIPAKLRALYQALCHEKQAPLPEIRTILSGSQSLGKEEVAQLKQFFTEAEITLYYGASELSYVTYIRDTQMNDDKTRIGRPFPGIDVQLEDGRLMVNTKWGVIGTRKEASAGDYAHLDEEGYFCFDGRKDDICSINGQKISCIRVEQAILSLGIGAEAAVKPVERQGRQYLAAWIVPKEKERGKNLEKKTGEIRSQLKTILSQGEIPKFFFFEDTLPVNESGKVLKRLLE